MMSEPVPTVHGDDGRGDAHTVTRDDTAPHRVISSDVLLAGRSQLAIRAGPLLAAHGIVAYAAIIAYALVGHAHLRTRWRVRGLRSAGLWLGAAVALLAVTGLGFYYVASETAIPYLRWAHVAAGVLLPFGMALHIARGRRVTRRS